MADWSWFLPALEWLIGIVVLIILLTGIKINKEWERAVILRLGKYIRTKKSGLFYIIPFIESGYRLDTRTQVMNVKPQDIITSDSVTVQVDAVVYYKVKDDKPEKAILNVEDFEDASTKYAQTTLRDIVGQKTLDDLLTKKSEVGEEIKTILDELTNPWAIQVESVEIKDVIIPKQLERAMAKEAEAIREQRARITKAKGEFEASKKLEEASSVLAKSKYGMELRKLQTWQEIGAEQNSLIVVVPGESKIDSLGLTALGKTIVEGAKNPSTPKGGHD